MATTSKEDSRRINYPILAQEDALCLSPSLPQIRIIVAWGNKNENKNTYKGKYV